MEIFILASLLVISIFIIVRMRIKTKEEDDARLHYLEQKERELHREISSLTESLNIYSQNVIYLQEQRKELENEITNRVNEAKQIVDRESAKYKREQETKVQDLLEKYRVKCEEEVDELTKNYYLYKNDIEEKNKKLADGLEDIASQYVAAITTYRQLELEQEKLLAYTVQLTDEDIEDIDYLIQNVVPKIHNPQILNKLIWSEYIQKPTNEMLSRVLGKKDCSGIYKITYVGFRRPPGNEITGSKRSYIGRSVSVKNRIQEHIKSSLGIGTIADQAIHKELRDKGIYNFTFELVEECDKDKLADREKYYIKFFDTERWGYNKNTGG